MLGGVPRPSPQLRAAIEQKIAEEAAGADLRSWPRRHFAGEKLLFLSGNQAVFWYLDLDGNVFWVDHDTFRMELVPETDTSAANDAIATRARTFPELLELLPK
jgi:hypothetical protein